MEPAMIDMLAKEPFFFQWQVAVVQMAGFAVFFLLMKWLLFDRLLGFMRARRASLEASAARAADARREVERLSAEYQAKLAAADKAAYEETQKMIREGIASKGAILQSAQEDGRKVVESGRAAVTAEREDAVRSMDASVRILAADLAAAATGGASASSAS
jgi:F-type H+-transporting ATPase subunit b